VVIDARIATTENLKAIKAENFDYLCVTRSYLKDYKECDNSTEKTITDKKGKKYI
jgi:hypothetical protein